MSTEKWLPHYKAVLPVLITINSESMILKYRLNVDVGAQLTFCP